MSAQTIQIYRHAPPPVLLPGVLSAELSTETKLWIGSGTGNRLLLSSNPADVSVWSARFLQIAGGTMLGPLVLAGNATLPLHPVPLQQLTATVLNYLPLAGGTLTGPLVLSADAAAPLNPVSLQQMTAAIAAGIASVPLANYLPRAGGTMTGPLVLAADATAPLQPVTLQQLNAANAAYLPLIGGTLTGPLSVQNQLVVTASSANFFVMKTAAAGLSVVYGYYNAAARWAIVLGDNTPESGGSTGSRFYIARYNDAGAFVDVPFLIDRATGDIALSQTSVNTQLMITGLSPLNTDTTLLLNRPAGKNAVLIGSTNGALRWALSLGNSVAESGGNAGSNFGLNRYTDAGAFIDSPLSINRASGDTALSKRLLAHDGVYAFNNDTTFGLFTALPSARYIQLLPNWAFQFGLVTGDLAWIANSLVYWLYRWSDYFAINLLGPVGGNGAYQNISDMRSKTAVSPAGVGLAEVLELQPINFTRAPPPPATSPSGKTMQAPVLRSEIGFAAQQVLPVIPQAVTAIGVVMPDGTGGLDTDDPSLAVSIDPIVAALVNATKELAARITALEHPPRRGR